MPEQVKIVLKRKVGEHIVAKGVYIDMDQRRDEYLNRGRSDSYIVSDAYDMLLAELDAEIKKL